MKKTAPILAFAVTLFAAHAQAQTAVTGLSVTGTGGAIVQPTTPPLLRSGTLNPEVAVPGTNPGNLNPEVNPVPGVLNPEVALPTTQVPAIPSSPTTVTVNPNGTIPSPPVADPSQIIQNPNPQSQVSAPPGIIPPGVDPNTATGAAGTPPANVRSGMHAPALGAKMNGAGQATPPATAPVNP